MSMENEPPGSNDTHDLDVLNDAATLNFSHVSKDPLIKFVDPFTMKRELRTLEQSRFYKDQFAELIADPLPPALRRELKASSATKIIERRLRRFGNIAGISYETVRASYLTRVIGTVVVSAEDGLNLHSAFHQSVAKTGQNEKLERTDQQEQENRLPRNSSGVDQNTSSENEGETNGDANDDTDSQQPKVENQFKVSPFNRKTGFRRRKLTVLPISFIQSANERKDRERTTAPGTKPRGQSQGKSKGKQPSNNHSLSSAGQSKDRFKNAPKLADRTSDGQKPNKPKGRTKS